MAPSLWAPFWPPIPGTLLVSPRLLGGSMAPRCVRWIAVCFVGALTASQATIAAPVAAPHAPVAQPTWSRAAEKKELLEIRRDAEERVLALVARMKGLPQGAAFEALERDAQGINRQ